VLGAPVGPSPNADHRCIRIALSLGLPIDTPAPKLVKAWSELPTVEPIPPRTVSDGPCKENKRFGAEIDLGQLPSPYIHEGDGGRYLNTYGIMIVATPDGSWVNWSITRVMHHGPRSMAGVIIPMHHLGEIHAEWEKLGKAMPFALCQGVDPGIAMAAGYPLDGNINEVDMIGGWYGEPIDVVKCETSDLQVPATSEIVIEGTVSLKDEVPEGPMGEYAGYTWVGATKKVPSFDVEAMTYRDQAIMPVCAAGIPTEENHTNWGISIAACIQSELNKTDLPVTACFIPFESAVHWLVVTVDVTQTELSYDELSRKIGEAVFPTRSGIYPPKIFVVNDDIDPSNIDLLVWAISTRLDPVKAIRFPKQKALPLVAYLTEEGKSQGTADKVVYNCLFPMNQTTGNKRPIEASFSGYHESLRQHVIDNWENYGFQSP
jgi:4-hydroxy-3-polyprenylbenzoate decarboxylase